MDRLSILAQKLIMESPHSVSPNLGKPSRSGLLEVEIILNLNFEQARERQFLRKIGFRALADFLTSLKGRLTGYITLHAYSQLWIYSYSHRKNTYAPDIADTASYLSMKVRFLKNE